MNRTIIFLSLFLSATLCQAQPVENKAVTTEIDSLLKVARENDTDFEKAMGDVLAAKAKALATFGDQAPQYAACLYLQGRIFYRQGKYEEAKQGCLDAMAIQANVLGKEHPDYVQSLTGLGDIYLNEGDFPHAEARLLEAQAISQQTGRAGDDVYATLLTSLGNYSRVTGNLDQAAEYYLECIEIRGNVFGKTHQKYAAALHNAALVKLQKGDYETAEKLFKEAQATFAKTLGTNSENYGICIQNLSGLYRKTGDFAKAEILALESLDITANILGETHADYAINLENLANLYLEMGNHEKAKAHYLQCKNLREATLGKDHYYYALSLNNLGNYFLAVQDFGQAEQHFATALDIYQKALGGEHYYTILAKGNLAWSHREQGKYSDAEPLILEVIRVREKYQGSEHPDLARSLVNLAFLQKHLGKYEEAKKLYRRAGQIWMKTAGPESLDYLASLQEMAAIQAITEQTEEALQNMAEAGQLQKMAYFRASKHLTENELAAYTARFSNYLHRHFSFLHNLRPAPGEATAQAFDDAIFHKGYLLENAGRVKKFTVQDAALAEQYEELSALQSALAAEYAKPPAARSGVPEMEEQATAIEKKLVTAVAGYSEIFQQVKWEEVRQNLRPKEAAVEFIHFEYLEGDQPTDSTMYAAIVLRAGAEFPDFVPLFEEKTLAKLMETGQGDRIGAINQLYFFDKNRPENSLYRRLWQPLEQALGDVATVYFSPSGLLHRLNLKAIQIENGQVLADRFQLVKMGSTRQLAFPKTMTQGNGGAVLFGGIKYDLDSLSANPAGGAPISPEALASRDAGTADGTTLRLRGKKWDYLGWTKTEIETIGLLTEGAGIPTRTFSGLAASEEACKKLSSDGPPPRILHFATHGYFFPNPSPLPASPEGGGDTPPKSSEGWGGAVSEHPMIRSGLILAGGNFAWKNGQPIRPGTDDGILTAYEIAQLDLSQTELVVLSACETGLGDIRGTEGVYGLQRAFKFAGAKYVLMSLWQVPDFQTQELMTAFYFNWLEEGMEIPAAFQAAQAELRKQYPEPFLWAGFVLMR